MSSDSSENLNEPESPSKITKVVAVSFDPNITLQFHVDRRWASYGSGVSNYFFGEYNGCDMSQTFRLTGINSYSSA